MWMYLERTRSRRWAASASIRGRRPGGVAEVASPRDDARVAERSAEPLTPVAIRHTIRPYGNANEGQRMWLPQQSVRTGSWAPSASGAAADSPDRHAYLRRRSRSLFRKAGDLVAAGHEAQAHAAVEAAAAICAELGITQQRWQRDDALVSSPSATRSTYALANEEEA